MEILRSFRERIESLDEQLAVLIADRLAVCSEVALVKKAEGIPMMQPDRVAAVRAAYADRGRALGVSPEFMSELASLLISEACRLEDEIIDGPGVRTG
ncbi:chorismate mutase [Umezawaea tangerina]|uniref:Chorismate mutase/isochorismate pyruvate lyase n=1 Tax=Umezawaea tangerina TaxID=84725 RepID=A0A2T0THI9_9PSEU|nr:chorismate mutase [Umezawaea tangerina]PRY45182.1 chorismate mutase/isochorismate pyruvate lyase [Umezawaea tangerina]